VCFKKDLFRSGQERAKSGAEQGWKEHHQSYQKNQKPRDLPLLHSGIYMYAIVIDNPIITLPGDSSSTVKPGACGVPSSGLMASTLHKGTERV